MDLLIALGLGLYIVIRMLVESFQRFHVSVKVLNDRLAKLDREREIAEMKKRAEQEQQGEQK